MMDHTFSNGQELLNICHEEQIPISEAAILAELSREEMDRDGIMSEMRLDLEVMRESIRVGLEEQQISITGLMGEDADKLMAFTDSAVRGREMTALSTDTGRMNCRNPNCQNMPRASNDPVGVRAFIRAPEGQVILSLDYSQIELRVGSFYCRDEVMLDTYRKNGDIHAATTSVLFGISYEEALDKHRPGYKEQRTIAKNVNFGFFYGLYANGLQQTLRFKAGIDKSTEECQAILFRLKGGYPGLSHWQEKAKAEAARRMYTETWLGRRR